MTLHAPQIIWIVVLLFSLVYSGYRHGKERTGTHNVFLDITGYILAFGLLYWGGFFG